MTTERPLVLVIAQSARFLAQQAAREGYRVRAIDQFNDADLISVCEQTSSFADFNQLNLAELRQNIIQLAGESPATLIAGTGAEVFYPLFNQLPSSITIANNSAACFDQCHNPNHWFMLLRKLQIPHPETCFERPSPSNDIWIFKQAGGWGGTQIKRLNTQIISKPGVYQRLITGQAFSVLFFADSNGWRWLGTQSQQSLPDHFIHQQLRSDFPLPSIACEQVTKIINQLNQTLQLRGFNSADFILTEQNTVLLLELNPRPAASMQLLDSPSMITAQIQACTRNVTAQVKVSSNRQTLVYLFASHSGHVCSAPDWPVNCHDLPAAGQAVQTGDIICSALIATSDDFEEKHAAIKWQVMQNIV